MLYDREERRDDVCVAVATPWLLLLSAALTIAIFQTDRKEYALLWHFELAVLMTCTVISAFFCSILSWNRLELLRLELLRIAPLRARQLDSTEGLLDKDAMRFYEVVQAIEMENRTNRRVQLAQYLANRTDDCV